MPFFSDLIFSSSSSSSEEEKEEDSEEGRWRKVEALLKENNVRKEWKKMILRDEKLFQLLYNVINHDEFDDFLPRKSEMLKAFSFAIPKDIKVILIGYTPINNDHFSDGLAISSPVFASDMAERKDLELPIYLLHQGLIKSKILEDGVDYYYGHEEWAKRGVFLLNLAMTTTKDKGGSDEWNKHFSLWNEFLKLILEKLINTKGLVTKRFVVLLGRKQEEFWETIPDSTKKQKIVVLKSGQLSFSENGMETYAENLKYICLEIDKIHRDIFLINKIRNDGQTYVLDKKLRLVSSEVINTDDTVCARRVYPFERLEDIVYVKEELLKQE